MSWIPLRAGVSQHSYGYMWESTLVGERVKGTTTKPNTWLWSLRDWMVMKGWNSGLQFCFSHFLAMRFWTSYFMSWNLFPHQGNGNMSYLPQCSWPDGCKELTHCKRPWCWERLKEGGEEDDRGWDGWMASPTQWTGVWVSSGSWWWTGRSGVLQSMGSQTVRHD